MSPDRARDVVAAIAGIGRALAAAPDQNANLTPALQLLTDLQHEQLAAQQDPRVSRFVRLISELRDREPGERLAIVRKRLGISRATYYRWLVDCSLSGA